MRYRLYQPDDFAALYAIEEVCFASPMRFSRKMMQRLVRRSNAAAWIAEEESMLAFAIVEWSGIAAYIETIEVLPEWRGRGIAGELLGCLEASARDSGARLIWLHVDAKNADAIGLYKKHGYRCEGREEDFYPQGRAAMVFAKLLSTAREADAD